MDEFGILVLVVVFFLFRGLMPSKTVTTTENDEADVEEDVDLLCQ